MLSVALSQVPYTDGTGAAPQRNVKAGCNQGGHRRSSRIEAYAAFIVAEYDAMSDIPLAELQSKVAASGTKVDVGTVWRSFGR